MLMHSFYCVCFYLDLLDVLLRPDGGLRRLLLGRGRSHERAQAPARVLLLPLSTDQGVAAVRLGLVAKDEEVRSEEQGEAPEEQEGELVARAHEVEAQDQTGQELRSSGANVVGTYVHR